MAAHLLRFPLILILAGLSALMMFLPMIDALARSNFSAARAFGYSGILGVSFVMIIGLAMSGRVESRGTSELSNLLSLFLAYILIPVFLALPMYEEIGTTSFVNTYLEMVSCFTTTGATLFEPGRLSDTLHLWRGLVGWGGGMLIWISASAVLAPLALGGFEVTASAEPGYGSAQMNQFERAEPAKRLLRATLQLAPIYIGLTGVLWILLMLAGDRALVALIHAMSTMATSGISSIGGVQGAASGTTGEFVIFLFMLFALSRLTFSSDTITTARPGLLNDPEFRLGVLLVVGVPVLLFFRHWLGAFEIDEVQNLRQGLKGLWGGVFTVLSFLSTTGFESADWVTAQDWSGLGTPGLIFLGLSLIGGGVATTAGGVKLLRVYALYLNGQREMERLVHPSSVGRAGERSRRIRREGAYIAWIFFMLFAMSLALIAAIFTTLGQNFEQAIVLTIAALSTTGPLVTLASETPISLLDLGVAAKLVLGAAMVVGRLETLAIIALFNPNLWRN